MLAAWIDGRQRLGDAVGAGRMVRARHYRVPARTRHRRGDPRVVGRHHHRPQRGLDGAAPDVDDHRFAVDVEQGLVRQP